ncbi:hypothetical protein PCASD_16035, partial [Puccinia coronata f. sp. avenae]
LNTSPSLSEAPGIAIRHSPCVGGSLREAPPARRGSPGPPKRGDCVKLVKLVLTDHGRGV